MNLSKILMKIEPREQFNIDKNMYMCSLHNFFGVFLTCRLWYIGYSNCVVDQAVRGNPESTQIKLPSIAR